MSKVSGGYLVAKAIKEEGIDKVFGLIGYYVSSVFNNLAKIGIEVIDTRHEQGAVHMADGYAQMTGQPGIAIVTGGPGFANSVSGIIKAYKSFTPMIVICGAFEPQKKDVGGLEDMELLSLVRQYTKWTATVHDTARIPEYISMAMRHALGGRKGPVVLEIPVNYLRQMIEEDTIKWPNNFRTDAKMYGDYEKVSEAVRVLMGSEKPVIIAGNGIHYAKAGNILKEFVEYTGIPVYAVNSGRGVLPEDHELCMGCGRTLESGPQLYAYKHADTVLVLGSSLDYSISFGKPPYFREDQTFIQVDIDPVEIGFSSRGIDIGIIGHSDVVLKQMLDGFKAEESFHASKFESWVGDLNEDSKVFWDKMNADMADVGEGVSVDPLKLLYEIQNTVPKESIFVLDGSNAMMWASLVLKVYEAGHMLIGPSGTYGSMGPGLPLAIGAKAAKPDVPVILYTGDGSFGFNAMEINTAVRRNIPVVVIVHNDNAWGFCRETQKVLYGEDDCDYGTELGFTRYDKMVEALGGHGELVENVDEIVPALKRALESKKVACINVVVDKDKMCPGSIQLNGGLRKIHDNL